MESLPGFVNPSTDILIFPTGALVLPGTSECMVVAAARQRGAGAQPARSGPRDSNPGLPVQATVGIP